MINNYGKADTGYLLTYKNDTLAQTMRVHYINSKKINFVLTSNNLLRNKETILTGIAEMDEVQDNAEDDVTEDGLGFYYCDWHYINKKCQLNMRIADSAQYIRIFDFGCNGLHDKSCPFETKGVLRRVDL